MSGPPPNQIINFTLQELLRKREEGRRAEEILNALAAQANASGARLHLTNPPTNQVNNGAAARSSSATVTAITQPVGQHVWQTTQNGPRSTGQLRALQHPPHANIGQVQPDYNDNNIGISRTSRTQDPIYQSNFNRQTSSLSQVASSARTNVPPTNPEQGPSTAKRNGLPIHDIQKNNQYTNNWRAQVPTLKQAPIANTAQVGRSATTSQLVRREGFQQVPNQTHPQIIRLEEAQPNHTAGNRVPQPGQVSNQAHSQFQRKPYGYPSTSNHSPYHSALNVDTQAQDPRNLLPRLSQATIKDMWRRINEWRALLQVPNAFFDFKEAFGFGNGWKVALQNGEVMVYFNDDQGMRYQDFVLEIELRALPEAPAAGPSRIFVQPDTSATTVATFAPQATPPATTSISLKGRSPSDANKKTLAKDLLRAFGKRPRPISSTDVAPPPKRLSTAYPNNLPGSSVPIIGPTTHSAQHEGSEIPSTTKPVDSVDANSAAGPSRPARSPPRLNGTPPIIPQSNGSHTIQFASREGGPDVPALRAASPTSLSEPVSSAHEPSKPATISPSHRGESVQSDAQGNVIRPIQPVPRQTMVPGFLSRTASPTPLHSDRPSPPPPPKSAAPSTSSCSLGNPSNSPSRTSQILQPSPSEEREPLFLPSMSPTSSRAPSPTHFEPFGSLSKKRTQLAYVLVPLPPPHTIRYRQLQNAGRISSKDKGKGVVRGHPPPEFPITPQSPDEDMKYDFSYDAQGSKIQEGLERDLMEVACTRMQRLPCKWGGCQVVMSSVYGLLEHLRQQHRKSFTKGKLYSCPWTMCGTPSRYGDRHWLKHALDYLLCPYKGCKSGFRTLGALRRHIEVHARKESEAHDGDPFKPAWMPIRPSNLVDPPPAPDILPAYRVLPLNVRPAPISDERRQALTPLVKQKISALWKPRFDRTRKFKLENQNDEGQGVYRYDFITDHPFRVSQYQSVPVKNGRFEPLNSEEVTELVENGLVILEDPDSVQPPRELSPLADERPQSHSPSPEFPRSIRRGVSFEEGAVELMLTGN